MFWKYALIATTLCFAVFPCIVVWLMMLNASSYCGKKIDVRNGQSRAVDTLTYVVSYIIPFIDLDVMSLFDIASIGVLLLVLGVVYVNSDLIYVNPFLSLMGYHAYRVIAPDDLAIMVLSRRRRADFAEAQLSLAELSDGVFLEVE